MMRRVLMSCAASIFYFISFTFVVNGAVLCLFVVDMAFYAQRDLQLACLFMPQCLEECVSVHHRRPSKMKKRGWVNGVPPPPADCHRPPAEPAEAMPLRARAAQQRLLASDVGGDARRHIEVLKHRFYARCCSPDC